MNSLYMHSEIRWWKKSLVTDWTFVALMNCLHMLSKAGWLRESLVTMRTFFNLYMIFLFWVSSRFEVPPFCFDHSQGVLHLYFLVTPQLCYYRRQRVLLLYLHVLNLSTNTLVRLVRGAMFLVIQHLFHANVHIGCSKLSSFAIWTQIWQQWYQVGNLYVDFYSFVLRQMQSQWGLVASGKAALVTPPLVHLVWISSKIDFNLWQFRQFQNLRKCCGDCCALTGKAAVGCLAD
jgi:hypothetical protein